MKNHPHPKDLLSKYRLLQDLMDNIPDVIYFKDKKGKLELVNHAHARGLGLKPEQVVGKTDFDFFPKERARLMARDDQQVFKTGKPIVDKVERATRPDGIDNYVSTTKIPRFDAKGEVIGLIGITRDITRRMHLEQEKEEKLSLQKKLKNLEEINRLKSDFISVVSHELRTPLAIIKEAVSLLFDGIAGAVSDKQKEILAKANQNSERLRKIIEDLLDMSRVESGKLKLRYSLVNLNELILDSAEYFRNLAADKGVDLIYSLPKEQVNIFVDAERTTQIITNLIANAVKFTEEGQEIRVEVEILENKVRVGVLDTGVGIRQEDLPKLFSKFTQVSNLPLAEKKGLGLGLAIARELVELQGGEIWAESKAGIGSKFYFTLPRFYALNQLGAQLKSEINKLLKEDVAVYMVNLLIVNYKKFKARIKVSPQKLFADLSSLIEFCLRDCLPAGAGKSELASVDEQIGECSILLAKIEERKVSAFCLELKQRLNNYLQDNKIRGAFITLGVAAFPSGVKDDAGEGVAANIHFKQIFVGAEMRRHKRLNYRLDIDFLCEKSRHPAQTIDISEGGVCFISKQALKTDAETIIRFDLPGEKQEFCLKGRVAWVSKSQGAPGYKIGLEFSGSNAAALKKLRNFINSIKQ
jgi:PAS domain S-box-containing protein